MTSTFRQFKFHEPVIEQRQLHVRWVTESRNVSRWQYTYRLCMTRLARHGLSVMAYQKPRTKKKKKILTQRITQRCWQKIPYPWSWRIDDLHAIQRRLPDQANAEACGWSHTHGMGKSFPELPVLGALWPITVDTQTCSFLFRVAKQGSLTWVSSLLVASMRVF